MSAFVPTATVARTAFGPRLLGGKTVKLSNILLVLGCALVGATTVLPAVAQQKPNVVFILADNVGYGDLGSYGGGELRGAPDAAPR